MINKIIYRIIYTVPIALSVSVICFLLLYMAPGDPIYGLVPPDTPADVIKMLRQEFGLDQPLPVQFIRWLGHIVQGDFGKSISTGQTVWSLLSVALANTFVLALCAAILGFVMGSVLGGIAGVYKNTWIDRSVLGTAVAGVSVPHYWLGMVLVIIFSVYLGWLPATGNGGGDSQWAWDGEHLRHLILPSITLAVIPAGLIARTVRGAVIEVLSQDFVTTLRANGILHWGIAKHVIKNVAPGVLAVMGLQLGYLMGGSILVETVFNWPGSGSLLNYAIFQRDIPIVQGTVLMLAQIFVFINLLVDLLQTALDPRIQR